MEVVSKSVPRKEERVATALLRLKTAFEAEYPGQIEGFVVGPNEMISLSMEMAEMMRYSYQSISPRVTEFLGVRVFLRQQPGMEIIFNPDLVTRFATGTVSKKGQRKAGP